MFSFSEVDDVGSVDSFTKNLPNKKISEDIRVGRYYNEKHFRNYNEICDNYEKTTDNNSFYKDKPKTHINIFACMVTIAVVIVVGIVAFFSLNGTQKYTTFYKSFKIGGASEKVLPYKGMCVLEQNSGRMILGENEEDMIPMASTTKIMTAIITIENTPDLERVVTVPDLSVGIEGTSIYLRKGEELSIIDMLYGLILASGNDSATALAIITAGSEEKFVEMMNNYADKLNLTHTHFTNPHGLHDDNHYTSAKDLATITTYAMKNEVFRKIVGTKRYTIEKTNKTEEPRYLKNKQKLMFDESLEEKGVGISGVKSGFTPEAGRCLVTSAVVDGKEVVAVVLNCKEMFEESQKLIIEASKKFHNETIVEPFSYIQTLPVCKSKTQELQIYTKKGLTYPIFNDGSDEIETQISLPEVLIAPIKKDQKVGTLSVKINDEEILVADLFALADAPVVTTIDIAKDILQNF